jgi:peptidyl-prolyl cis-trans isomerase B (cyclophilin B)
MARSGHPDSAGSQFFLMLGAAPSLDRQYTGFGRLIKGEDVLMRIGETPVGPNRAGERSKPLKRVEVQSVQIVSRESVS